MRRIILVLLCVFLCCMGVAMVQAQCCPQGGSCCPQDNVCQPPKVEQGTPVEGPLTDTIKAVIKTKPLRTIIKKEVHKLVPQPKPAPVPPAACPCSPPACSPAATSQQPPAAPPFGGGGGFHGGPGPMPFHGGGGGDFHGGGFHGGIPWVVPFVAPLIIDALVPPYTAPPGYQWTRNQWNQWTLVPYMAPVVAGAQAGGAVVAAVPVEFPRPIKFFHDKKPVRGLLGRLFHRGRR